MATSMVASVILVNRKEGTSEEKLLQKVNWVYEEIQARNGIMSVNRQPSISTVRTALSYLSGFLEKKKDAFEP